MVAHRVAVVLLVLILLTEDGGSCLLENMNAKKIQCSVIELIHFDQIFHVHFSNLYLRY